MCQWLVLRGEGGWGGPVLAGGSSGGAQMPSVSRTVWRVRPRPYPFLRYACVCNSRRSVVLTMPSGSPQL